jgi:type IV secretory pathway VirB10-like protein
MIPTKFWIIALLLIITACGSEDDDNQGFDPSQGSSALQTDPDPFPGLIQDKPAELSVTIKNVDFGDISIGDEIVKTINYSNTGDVPLQVDSILLANPNPDILITDSCNITKKELITNNICQISIEFKPTTAGRADNTILFNHTGVNSPVTVTITANTLQKPEFVEPVMPVLPPPTTVPQPPVYPPISESLLRSFQLASQTMAQRRNGSISLERSSYPVNRDIFINYDDDYKSIGLSSVKSTLPVNREYMITMDRYIPAVLENRVISNSGGGRIMAVIESNVFSSEGRNILISAGSRVIGNYGALANSPSDVPRLQVSWDRIIRPDGSSIVISSPAVDVSGTNGIPGHTDYNLFDRFGMPLLLSSISGAVSFLTGPGEVANTRSLSRGTNGGGLIIFNDNDNETISREQALGKAVAEGVYDDAIEIINERIVNNDIEFVIPSGTRFYIIPTQDIVMKNPNSLESILESAGDPGERAKKIIRALRDGRFEDGVGELINIIGDSDIGLDAVGQFNSSGENLPGIVDTFRPDPLTNDSQAGRQN